MFYNTISKCFETNLLLSNCFEMVFYQNNSVWYVYDYIYNMCLYYNNTLIESVFIIFLNT